MSRGRHSLVLSANSCCDLNSGTYGLGSTPLNDLVHTDGGHPWEDVGQSGAVREEANSLLLLGMALMFKKNPPCSS